MSSAKRLLERKEEQRGFAIEIALKAGALKRCEIHEHILMEGDRDIEEAYKLGNARFSAGELPEHFADRREMTDTIKDVVEDNNSDTCPDCADNAAE